MDHALALTKFAFAHGATVDQPRAFPDLEDHAAGRVAQKATEKLLRHVQGIMQMIGQAVGGTGVYGRAGAVAGPVEVVSSFAATA